MEYRKPALQNEYLRTKQLAIDLSVLGNAMIGRCVGVSAPFAPFGGFSEEGLVEARGVVGGEVGGEEEVGRVERKREGGCRVVSIRITVSFRSMGR